MIEEMIPKHVEQALSEFMARGKTGSVQFDVKDGRIAGAKFTEVYGAKPPLDGASGAADTSNRTKRP